MKHTSSPTDRAVLRALDAPGGGDGLLFVGGPLPTPIRFWRACGGAESVFISAEVRDGGVRVAIFPKGQGHRPAFAKTYRHGWLRRSAVVTRVLDLLR